MDKEIKLGDKITVPNDWEVNGSTYKLDAPKRVLTFVKNELTKAGLITDDGFYAIYGNKMIYFEKYKWQEKGEVELLTNKGE